MAPRTNIESIDTHPRVRTAAKALTEELDKRQELIEAIADAEALRSGGKSPARAGREAQLRREAGQRDPHRHKFSNPVGMPGQGSQRAAMQDIGKLQAELAERDRRIVTAREELANAQEQARAELAPKIAGLYGGHLTALVAAVTGLLEVNAPLAALDGIIGADFSAYTNTDISRYMPTAKAGNCALPADVVHALTGWLARMVELGLTTDAEAKALVRRLQDGKAA